MEYYTGAIMFGIIPAIVIIVASYLLGQIRPIRKAIIRWIEH